MENHDKHDSQLKFAVGSKFWFLTFPKCPMTKEEVHALLEAKGRLITGGVIARLCGPHGVADIHVCLFLVNKFATRDPCYWDLKGYHGRYQSARSYSSAMARVSKDKTRLCFGTVPDLPTTATLAMRTLTEPLFSVMLDYPFAQATRRDILSIRELNQTRLVGGCPAQHARLSTWITTTSVSDVNWAVQGLEPDLYVKSADHLWSAYVGQTAVLIPDYRLGLHALVDLMHWSAPRLTFGTTTGLSVPLTYDRLIVTSLFTIEQAFAGYPISAVDSVRRNFKEIHRLAHNLCLSDID
jgi:Geminivirus Rep catalytic domain.